MDNCIRATKAKIISSSKSGESRRPTWSKTCHSFSYFQDDALRSNIFSSNSFCVTASLFSMAAAMILVFTDRFPPYRTSWISGIGFRFKEYPAQSRNADHRSGSKVMDCCRLRKSNKFHDYFAVKVRVEWHR